MFELVNDFGDECYDFHRVTEGNEVNTRRFILIDRSFKCLKVRDAGETIPPLISSSIQCLKWCHPRTFFSSFTALQCLNLHVAISTYLSALP